MHESTTPELAMLRPKRCISIQSRLVDGEMVVLDRQHELIHQFNKTATFIWEQCDGQRSAAEIAAQVCNNFEVDESTALKEVIQTLETLKKLNLVEDASK